MLEAQISLLHIGPGRKRGKKSSLSAYGTKRKSDFGKKRNVEKNQKRRVPQSKKDLFFGTLSFFLFYHFVTPGSLFFKTLGVGGQGALFFPTRHEPSYG